MRKANHSKNIQPLSEILDEMEQVFVVYPVRARKPTNVGDCASRRKLLNRYLKLSDESLFELGKCQKWFADFGFPGFIDKDIDNNEFTRPEEVFWPILFSAQSVRALYEILKAWKQGDSETLRRLIVVYRPASGEFEDKQSLEQQKYATIVGKLVREKAGRKKKSNSSRQTVKYTFAKAEAAWSAIRFSHGSFGPRLIEPFELPDDSARCLLEQTELFLIRAANIMLTGLRPTLVRDVEGSRRIQLAMECGWHAIAIAFAELITESPFEIRWCICGKDISHLKNHAVVCSQKCQRKKVGNKGRLDAAL